MSERGLRITVTSGLITIRDPVVSVMRKPRSGRIPGPAGVWPAGGGSRGRVDGKPDPERAAVPAPAGGRRGAGPAPGQGGPGPAVDGRLSDAGDADRGGGVRAGGRQ